MLPATVKPQITQLCPPPPQCTDALGTPTLHATSSHSLSDGLQLRIHKPMHLEQDTTLPSPSRGPHKPLQLTIPPPSPPPTTHPLPPVQATHSSTTRRLEAQDTLSKNQAKKEMERCKGCRQGPQNVSYAIKAAVELESP